MSFVIGKSRIAYPPTPHPDAGAQPFLTGGIPKVGSILSANTGGSWNGASNAFAYQWFVGGVLAYASATAASYSVSAANTGAYVSCKVLGGNATWGTFGAIAQTGTVIP